jgi:1-acyl-sn-glycerol-3-phosphate acyltransferase
MSGSPATGPAPAAPRELSRGLPALFGEGLRLGWIYPAWAVLRSALRGRPPHERSTREWCRLLIRRYAIRFERDPASAPLLAGRRCLWICPHRSVADFFVHKELVEGRGATLSRTLVAGVFPMIWLASRLDRSVWFFRRDKAHTRDAFYRWLDREFERCPLEGLIVYAEGHRSQLERPLPLKAGMIRYAFRRGLPVQVVMTGQTEQVIDERRRIGRTGVTVPYRVEPPLEPGDYPDERAFFRAVSELFQRAFHEVAGGPPPRVRD